MVKIIVPYLKQKGFKIEALWGRTLSKAEETANELGISYHTNKIDNVLLRRDVDLIFILCSPDLQAQIAVKALGIGKHVVCDKPAGLCQSEAIKMVHAAQYYPSLISIINHSLRFLPAFAHMKKAISEGFIGSEDEITACDIRVQMETLYLSRYNWLCEKSMGGGVLTLIGSHVIDLISYLINQKAVRVHGIVKTFEETSDTINGIRRITSSDFCTFQMEMSGKFSSLLVVPVPRLHTCILYIECFPFSGNALVTVTLNSQLPGVYQQEVLICGKKGHLLAKGGDLHGFKKSTQKEEVLYLDVEDLQKSDKLNPLIGNIIPKPYVRGFFKMIGSLKEAFLPVEDKNGWIKQPVADASTFEDGLYVQAVIDALYRSNTKREWVRVDMITEEPDPNPLLSAAVRRTGISL